MQRAKEVGLDLVEVAPQEKPPVCRIMDYGKFKYQQKKRQHKGHTHHIKNKELRVRPKIGDHDLMTKVNRAKEFLAEKDKVIFSVIFRGRENAHTEEGYKLVKELMDFATQERFQYRHKWKVGDVLAWDNACTLHKGTPFDSKNEIRHVNRTWVRGERPH